ncbi:MAG: hypothetical protein VB125_01365 [Burkholderia sp.]
MRNIGAVPLLAIRVSAYIFDFCRRDAQGNYGGLKSEVQHLPRGIVLR